MIDIHAHILPELDDGAFDMVCSVEMAELAVESGVSAMMATPHSNQRGYFENYASPELFECFDALKSELRRNEIPLELYLGMEVFGTPDTAQLYRDGKLLTLNGGRYMLVEFDFAADAYYMDSVLYDLMDAGCIPVVAHPERYDALQASGDIVAKWLGDGMGIQVNKGSLSGRFGRGAKRLAYDLLEQGLISCVASDAHGTRSRSPDMSDVREFLAVEYSEELAELLLTENPKRIVQSKPLLKMEDILL